MVWATFWQKHLRASQFSDASLFSEALAASPRSVRVLSQASCCGAEDSSLSGIRAFSVALSLAS